MIKELSYPLPWNDNWAIVDSSKLVEAIECFRKYFFRHVLGWASTAPNNHLVFGTAWHKAMEHLLVNGYDKVSEAMILFMSEYRKEFPPESDELYFPKTPSKAQEALNLYANQFKHDPLEWKTLYTEIAGTVMLTDEFVMHFRMDSILEEIKSGRKLSLDHKTGSKKGRTWSDKFLLGMQTGVYTHVLYCLYPREEVRGVLYRGTFFYKRNPCDFEEVPCWKTLNQMQVWLWNAIYWYSMLKTQYELLSECKDSDEVLMAFPMNTESCTKYFGCPYHDFCTAWSNPLQKADQPPMGFETRFWNPAEEEPNVRMEGLK